VGRTSRHRTLLSYTAADAQADEELLRKTSRRAQARSQAGSYVKLFFCIPHAALDCPAELVEGTRRIGSALPI